MPASSAYSTVADVEEASALLPSTPTTRSRSLVANSLQGPVLFHRTACGDATVSLGNTDSDACQEQRRRHHSDAGPLLGAISSASRPYLGVNTASKDQPAEMSNNGQQQQQNVPPSSTEAASSPDLNLAAEVPAVHPMNAAPFNDEPSTTTTDVGELNPGHPPVP
jgi:hypothetical protein